MGIGAKMTLAEYRAAKDKAAHGSARRYLTGCRCARCDRPPNQRFALALPPYRVALK